MFPCLFLGPRIVFGVNLLMRDCSLIMFGPYGFSEVDLRRIETFRIDRACIDLMMKQTVV